MKLVEVDYGIPSEANIELEVWGLKVGRSGGQSGMLTEDLNEWLRKAKSKKEMVRRRCELVVRLIQLAFGDGTLSEDLAWSTMVLLPKGKGGYRGIISFDVTLKVCIAGVNCHLKRIVELNDALHGFREGWEMWTANLEAKLEQQISGLAHEPIFQVFMDV